MQTTSELLQSTITFVCYGDSGKCTFYEDDGATFMYQDGAYNEWRIRIDNTRFLAQPVELGFDSRQRLYRMTYKGETSDVTLSP
jgi:alpha-glucosidase (family GH31 glycosyl hydrolase)